MAIEDLGFTNCTEVQGLVLPYSLSNYDIAAQAQTGTGKTAAFLISILVRLIEDKTDGESKMGLPRALIIAPTRELVLQIEQDFKKLNLYGEATAVALIGGTEVKKQLNALQRKPVDIVIATPGRLLDFCDRGALSLKQIEILVIDEADRMLDLGFIPSVRRIISLTPQRRERQTMFFSATLNDDVHRLIDQWTHEPISFQVQSDSIAAELVEQQFWLVSRRDRVRTLIQFLTEQQPKHVLIFVNRRNRVATLLHKLKSHGIKGEGLAGDLPQRRRIAIMNRFKKQETNLVVATDVAGRGIHVEGISHVINFDLPNIAEDYVHRIGRTGRAGEYGVAISFVSEDNAFYLPELEQLLGHSINCIHPGLSSSTGDQLESIATNGDA